jgi:ribonuclease BN (tRNA processing enzyme)
MRIVLLGAGEAFDETLGNTSALVIAESTILVDCGYAGAFQVWRHDPSPDLIDAIYISHAHADHYFGLPALLARMWEEGRKKPLTLISQASVLEQISQIMELGYAGLRKRFDFPIETMEASPRSEVDYRELKMTFAPTIHSTTNLAVRMENNGRSFCFSGDGMFTDESQALFAGADLLLHEAFSFEQSPVHADIPRLIQMAEDAQVKHLVLTHVQRRVRRDDTRLQSLQSKIPLTLAAPRASFTV